MRVGGFEKRRPPIADDPELDPLCLVQAHQMFEVHASHAANAEDPDA
jgi:hypothetical protein